jgi:hypothetical protein
MPSREGLMPAAYGSTESPTLELEAAVITAWLYKPTGWAFKNCLKVQETAKANLSLVIAML